MGKIEKIVAREILDSRGRPTLEVDLTTEDGLFRAAVPSGKSTGEFEALELRDHDKARFWGEGVLTAVKNVTEVIAPKLIGKDVLDQKEIDKYMVEELDGTKNEWGWSKSKLGANAILGVSMAVCRAGARAKKMPLYAYIAHLAGKSTEKMVLPVPCFNVINGGVHAGNRLAPQEFLLLPVGATSVREAVRYAAEVYHELSKVIKEKYGLSATNVGDEGGFAPDIDSGEEALKLITEAIEKSGHSDTVKIGFDAAASSFYNKEEGLYDLDFKNPQGSPRANHITGEKLSEIYVEWGKKYPLLFMEDPFDENDFSSFAHLTSEVGEKYEIIGDDLLVTNPTRIELGVEKKACNGLLLKLNQIGTVSETIEACKIAEKAGWGVLVSHRSGETEDSFIADLVVGLRTGHIKTGAPCRSERNCKYNQLMRIEEELGEKGLYAGSNFRRALQI